MNSSSKIIINKFIFIKDVLYTAIRTTNKKGTWVLVVKITYSNQDFCFLFYFFKLKWYVETQVAPTRLPPSFLVVDFIITKSGIS